MKIVQEIFDKEYYVDQILTVKEVDLLKDYMVLSYPCNIEGRKINLGIKVEIFSEDDD